MKSVLLAGLFVTFIALSYGAKQSAVEAEGPETRTDIQRAGGGGGSGGGGAGGGGGSGGGGWGQVYHETHGTELFEGESYMLLIPLLILPLLAFACYYFLGGSKESEAGWGWDRMGYSDATVGGASAYPQGSYDARSFVAADSLPKSVHNRIFQSIQQ